MRCSYSFAATGRCLESLVRGEDIIVDSARNAKMTREIGSRVVLLKKKRELGRLALAVWE